MMTFLRRTGPATLSSLGPLELQLMQILWSLPPAGVFAREVQEALTQPLAYTTITTTLDRLCKKNLVDRHKADRAYIYTPKFTRLELEQREANDAIRALGTEGQLISCLIDAVEPHDTALLDELEAQIRRKREELKKQGGQA